MTTPTTASRASHPVDDAAALLTGRRLVVLTGAGLSTDSGIPDYRGTGAPVRRPMTYQEFRSGPVAQRRYWARSFIGWDRMTRAVANPGHRAVAELDAALVATQNVDGLHEEAGTPRLVALHGRISEVVCLDCGTLGSRTSLQQRLAELNPGFAETAVALEQRPDGDVELADTESFQVADCEVCGGALKPDVVFFGENVPHRRVRRCQAAIDSLDPETGALLVAGSSLTVMSGFRFVRQAAGRGVPVVIVNRGPTRGDELATLRVEAGTSEALPLIAAARRQRD